MSALLCSVQNIYLLERLQFWFSFCKQYTLIKACHLKSNEYIYCNISIFGGEFDLGILSVVEELLM